MLNNIDNLEPDWKKQTGQEQVKLYQGEEPGHRQNQNQVQNQGRVATRCNSQPTSLDVGCSNLWRVSTPALMFSEAERVHLKPRQLTSQ